ncbi:hypothetical protein K461DRAFT_66973 [Myriangium duriaei CBS 260.36]|uniref:Uncharacterized protein n=1 Tax=Myriangium duriaei CBS 260.36 TaxID=1168546 RepID=A0A9P4IW43_9PEZI|nr:hypothetical protein K461DRAFT_66973 [Myriangium duriaei CBS 260.36]
MLHPQRPPPHKPRTQDSPPSQPHVQRCLPTRSSTRPGTSLRLSPPAYPSPTSPPHHRLVNLQPSQR